MNLRMEVVGFASESALEKCGLRSRDCRLVSIVIIRLNCELAFHSCDLVMRA